MSLNRLAVHNPISAGMRRFLQSSSYTRYYNNSVELIGYPKNSILLGIKKFAKSKIET